MKTLLEVKRYSQADVIATSCIQKDGMSLNSYAFCGDVCGWQVGNDIKWKNCDFDYYDENGTLQNKTPYQESEDWGLDGVYFHYKTDATKDSGYVFEICTNPDHQDNGN